MAGVHTYGLGSTYNGLTLTGNRPVGRPSVQVSFNRPFLNRASSSVNQFFNAEYALVRWLERKGTTRHIFPGRFGPYGALLKNHKLFVSSGHYEYWSGAIASMRGCAGQRVNLAF